MKFRSLRNDEVEVRVATVTEKGVSLLLYKDARCDMNVLDETVGVENWQNKFYEHKGILFCSLGINTNYANPELPDRWVWKDDAGVESTQEAEKGNASDARKRSGVAFGIGRELYTAPFIWVSECQIVDTGRKDARGKPVYTCKDKFCCSMMEVTEGKITALAIKNNKGEVVFTYGNRNPAPVCEECGKPIQAIVGKSGKHYTAEQTAEMTKMKYGKVLCGDCV